jgi:hypothetical protein
MRERRITHVNQAGTAVPTRGLLVQRRCACGAKAGPGGQCADCARKEPVQTHLTLGSAADPLEREADHIAHEALAGSIPAPVTRSAVAIRRAAGKPAEGTGVVPSSVGRTIESRGRSLDPALRHDMEQRFGHDFSRVRVHTGAAAEQSAREIGAEAYTVGNNVVFGERRPAEDRDGRRSLLAHELVHVIQQQGAEPMVQRKPDDAPAPAAKSKIDVSIVLSDGDQDLSEGAAYAKTVLRVTDVADAAAKLKALGAPVGKLFVVSHSNAAGKVQFVSSIGTINWVPIGDLATALKGAVAIDEVDFRGCKVGDAPAAMESFRQTVGAQATRGSNCWTFIQRATPLTLNGVDVTTPSQIPKNRLADFDKALLQQLKNMTADNGVGVADCLVGLAPGEKANKATLAKIWKLYWANNGNLIASWGSPNYNHDWQADSICSKDMTATTKPCAIVETKAPAPATGGGGGKSSALEQPQPGVDVDSVAEAVGGSTPRPSETA